MPTDRVSSRVRNMPPSGIRRFFDIAATMEDVISLSVGEPDFMTPQHIRDAAHHAIEISNAYTSNSGLIELREAIAEHLYRRYGVAYNADTELMITAGVSEGLQSAALALFDPGDEVIMTDPGYVAYSGSIMIANATPICVPTYAANAFQVTAADIEAHITPRTRAILLGYPSNPTGAVMSREGLLEIAAVVERHNLVVISDEIYDRLVYGAEHVCFSSMPGMRERTVLMGGFSKAYAMTGWRLGWTAAPRDLTEAAGKIHQYGMLSAPTMSQHAALQAIRHGEDDVQQMVAEYDRRRRYIVDRFNHMGLPTVEPQGAFFAFPYIGHLSMSSDMFAERVLQEAHVAIIPGSAFGAYGEGFVRVCYATSLDRIEAALDRIESFLERNDLLRHTEPALAGAELNGWNAGQYAA
ncbi:MAG: aminotransferase class I/II-fold pyridoxal phosphate-dependent enzyme [Chloroflexaceae bacterium]|nr:aminotransferase class I/II-fold pyridoxal phosphate-dependent enzyme [Chloroflexaceae bacterium]